MSIPPAALAGLEAFINGWLRMDPDALERLASLHGRVIAVELHGLNLRLYLRPGAQGLQILDACADAPDTVLSGTPLSLLRLAADRAKRETLFSGDVEIRGDVELGRRFKEILDSIEIDWEEPLSRVVGDVVAHQAGNLARGAAAWGRRALDSLSRDMVEYLQEERRQVPPAAEVDIFLNDVDQLRIDTDRLEARVKRLAARTAGHDNE